MDAKSLKRLLPRNKDDAEGAKALVALGYPAVEPVMPLMLDWLKSNGSPVELVMCDFFASLGARAVPVVQKALASRHDGLKLATGSGYYGTDLIALHLLVEHRLADPDWLKEWAEFKTKRLRELLSQAEHVEGLLAK